MGYSSPIFCQYSKKGTSRHITGLACTPSVRKYLYKKRIKIKNPIIGQIITDGGSSILKKFG
jgi:hypothetical protein